MRKLIEISRSVFRPGQCFDMNRHRDKRDVAATHQMPNPFQREDERRQIIGAMHAGRSSAGFISHYWVAYSGGLRQLATERCDTLMRAIPDRGKDETCGLD